MKKLFKYSIILLLLITTSCDEGMLDVSNPNTFTSADFWKTEEDINKGLVAVYNMFYKQGTWTRNIYTQMNGMADDGVSLAGWTELAEWTKFRYTNYDFAESPVKIWKEHYKAIFRANQVLDNIPNVEFQSEKAKNSIIGQAKFLRAFYYFYLAVFWENVPLVLETSSPSDRPQQVSVDELWSHIVSDLNDAVQYLPEQWDNANLGRPTKGAAYAYLGKAFMQQHKWPEARDAFSWLVEGEGAQYYDLVANYEHNFRGDTENNMESVFEIQFSQIHTTGYDHDFSTTSNLGTQIAMNHSPKGLGWNNIQARRWLVDYYKRETTVDGKNDMRLFYNLWYDDRAADFPEQTDVLIYGRTWDEDPTWGSQVFIRKYTSNLPDRQTEFYWHNINYRVVRYADILLSYAEVLNEISGGPTPLAIELVNKVRSRVNLPNIQDSEYYDGAVIVSNKEAFLEHLKVERALELPLETVRWIDLKRWDFDAETVQEIQSRDPDFNTFILGRHERLPIPQSEVNNNVNLDQNPDY